VKVTTEHTPDCNAVVTVEVDDERIQSALKTAAQRISRARPIPGFRPGKAPYAMVERTFGKELLLDEAIDGMAQQIYREVLKDEKIDVYDSGKLDVVQKEPVILRFTIPTRPVVTLSDYHTISLKPRPVEVTDAEVDAVLARSQKDAAEMVPVTRAVQMNDMVTIDVKGGLEGADPFSREGMPVTVEKAGGVFPWLDQLVGTNPGETRTINYTYPEDAGDAFKGKTATFTVTVTDVKEPQLPELNDEFAKSISTFETLEQLKRRVRADLYEEKERVESDRFSDEVLDTIVDQSQIAYPASMLEDEVEQEVARAKDLASRLGLTWDKYLELGGRSADAYRSDARPRAEKRLKRLLVMLQLVEEEKVEVKDKEVDVEIDERARQAELQGGNAAQTRRKLSTPESRGDIELNLKLRKTVDRIVAMAKGEPTSGMIVTPEMLRQEMRAREQEKAQTSAPAAGGLITDPSQVTSENWPKGLDHPLVPGEDDQSRTRR
jgi:trigger factor